MADEDHKDYRTLGEILRDARQARKQSVEDLAAITKITAKSIRAIEADDIDQLAGPVYARGFVRTLAEAHGLEPGFLLTKLATASAAMAPPPSPDLPSPENPIKPTITPRTEIPRPDGGPTRDEGTWHVEQVRVHHVEAGAARPWLWWLVGTAVLVALVAVLWALLRPGADGRADGAAPRPDPMLTAADPGPPPGLTEGSRVRSPDPAAADGDTGVAGTDAADAASDPDTPTPQNADPPTSRPEPTAADAAPARDDPDPVPTSGVDAATEAPADVVEAEDAPPETAKDGPADATARRNRLSSIVRPSDTGAEMELVVEAQGRVDVWAGADGEARRRHSLGQGESITLSARDHFSLLLSDPRAVVVRLDGKRRTPPSGLRGEWILYPDPQ